jgi:hypothetical protein
MECEDNGPHEVPLELAKDDIRGRKILTHGKDVSNK